MNPHAERVRESAAPTRLNHGSSAWCDQPLGVGPVAEGVIQFSGGACSVRASEAAALQFKNLDLGSRPQLHVRRAYVRGQMGAPKSRHGRCSIPLADEQDAAIYLTAAFSGLRRSELLALRWRDVDFAMSTLRVSASFAAGEVTSSKSGKPRAVPLAAEVATALARLGQRGRFTDDDDLVFPGELGAYLDGSALRRRYERARARAGLRPLRFHDLRHTFGTRMIAKADILRVKEWMGHADVQTTMRYLHYAPRPGDARLVDEAFAVEGPAELRAHDGVPPAPVVGIEGEWTRGAGGDVQASRTSVSHASRSL